MEKRAKTESKIKSPDISTYETSELKLAALLKAELPVANFQIYDKPNSLRKTIEITYPNKYKDIVVKLEHDFINKKAVSNIYAYNKALNMIRDRLRGRNEGDEGRLNGERYKG